MALPGEQYKPCLSCIQSETRLANPLRNRVHKRLHIRLNRAEIRNVAKLESITEYHQHKGEV